jgi:7,8-dihydropterin-6-yl-methyl-4-(beta-D-ribofuranosyl)aminobenzene 5'-phosphate synthase
MTRDANTAFRTELAAARTAEDAGDFPLAKHHLERAHILGQRRYLTHIHSHYRMLRLAMKQSDGKEIRGQLTRLIGAGPFHLVGWVPLGNTGGADVSPVRPMPLPADIKPYFDGDSRSSGLIARAVLVAALGAAYLLFRNQG